MVMLVPHWAGKEWNSCSSNIILTPPSQFCRSVSNNLETLLTHTALLFHILQVRPRNSSVYSFTPTGMTSDLPPLLPCGKSPRLYMQAVIHTHTCMHNCTLTETSRPQNTSSPAQCMINTEFRPRCSGCHPVGSWKPAEMEISQLLWASCSICIFSCQISWRSFSLFFQPA